MWSQERAAKWRTPDGLMDGLTTNGVLVMHPAGGFSEDSAPGVWREISVCGNVYTLRDSRSAQQRGKLVGGLSTLLPTPSSFLGPPNLPFPLPKPGQMISSPAAQGIPNRVHLGARATCTTEGNRPASPSVAHILPEVPGVM